MLTKNLYQTFTESLLLQRKLLSVLVDPDKFELDRTAAFLRELPVETTHIFVGGSTVPAGRTESLVKAIKMATSRPVLLFPGDHSQITDAADGLLFLTLLSGRNPEYLIEQQLKAVPKLKATSLEVIPTGYLLIDGGHTSSVERVTGTAALSQNEVEKIVHTAVAGELMGAQLVYLEAGSGAKNPVGAHIISEVKKEISIPLIVGGGIRTDAQKQSAYSAGADMVVMGTVFEKGSS